MGGSLRLFDGGKGDFCDFLQLVPGDQPGAAATQALDKGGDFGGMTLILLPESFALEAWPSIAGPPILGMG